MNVPSDAQTVAQLRGRLGRYLRHLPHDRNRTELLERVVSLSEPARAELIKYLLRLNGSPAADPRFRETYLFAPRRWPERTVLSTAQDWADIALRHLLPPADGKVRQALLFRETGGISDMWLLRVPPGFSGELHPHGSTLAIAAVGGAATIDGTEIATGRSIAFGAARSAPLRLHSTAQESIVVLVASPALSDRIAPNTAVLRGLAMTASPNATAERPRPRYSRGPRCDSVGHLPPQHPSSPDRSPITATSSDLSAPR